MTSSNIELTTYTSLLSRTCSKEQFRSIYSRLTTKSSVVMLKSTTCCISQVSCFLIGCRLLHPSRGSNSSVQLAAEATSVRLVAEAPHLSGLRQQPCGSVFLATVAAFVPSSSRSCLLLTRSLHRSSCDRNFIRPSRCSAAAAGELHFIVLLYCAF